MRGIQAGSWLPLAMIVITLGSAGEALGQAGADVETTRFDVPFLSLLGGGIYHGTELRGLVKGSIALPVSERVFMEGSVWTVPAGRGASVSLGAFRTFPGESGRTTPHLGAGLGWVSDEVRLNLHAGMRQSLAARFGLRGEAVVQQAFGSLAGGRAYELLLGGFVTF